MEWPAKVLAAQPFTVRLVGFNVGCENMRFDPGTTVDNSAVTFEPLFLISGPLLACPLDNRESRASAAPPIAAFFVTQVSVAGLTAQSPRSYEIRGAADVSAAPTAPSTLPLRTFGAIVVRGDTVDSSQVNAGGRVSADRDSAGCVRIFAGLNQYVVENPPADTATNWSAFVQDYLHRAAAPVCGDSIVFHLISRN